MVGLSSVFRHSAHEVAEAEISKVAKSLSTSTTTTTTITGTFEDLAKETDGSIKGMFINNEFRSGTSGRFITAVDPTTEQVIGKVQEASNKDIDAAVESSSKAFENVWRHMDGNDRRDLLNRLADLILLYKEEITKMEARHGGKPVGATAAVDLRLVVETLRYYAGWADKQQGKHIPIKSLSNTGNSNFLCYTRHEPVGVVASIIPWNFPLLMLAWKIAPAIAVGCTCVVKTSEKTPFSALLFAKLIKLAGFPDGVLNFVTGDGTNTGHYLASHPGVSKIAFTGSSATGSAIMKNAADHDLKRVSLELGGKSPLVVFKDADIDQAVEVAHTGVFLNNGQCCIASTRIFVEDSIYDTFASKCVERARKACVSCPLKSTCTQGPLVDKAQFDKVMKYIEQGTKEGAKCLTGGHRHGDKGYFVEPTVFGDVTDSMVIAKEEIFGPVMSLLKFSDINELITRCNTTHYGLGAGVCTRDIGKALYVSNNIRAGTVYINCYDVFDPAAPFGGFKQSGMGRELGEYGLELYTEIKTVIADLSFKV